MLSLKKYSPLLICFLVSAVLSLPARGQTTLPLPVSTASVVAVEGICRGARMGGLQGVRGSCPCH